MMSAAKAGPAKTRGSKETYEMDTYTCCLLATDKEDVNRCKVIKFNPCTKHEETIAERLSYQHDCAMASLEGIF